MTSGAISSRRSSPSLPPVLLEGADAIDLDERSETAGVEVLVAGLPADVGDGRERDD